MSIRKRRKGVTTCAARCSPTSSPPRRRLLADARIAYDGGAPEPLPEEKGDAEKYRQRIGRLREAVQLHQRNVDALKKELAAAR